MLGWFREASSLASRSNRTSRSGSAANASGRTLIATSRSSVVSSARHTSPIPPSPIFSRRRKCSRESPGGGARGEILNAMPPGASTVVSRLKNVDAVSCDATDQSCRSAASPTEQPRHRRAGLYGARSSHLQPRLGRASTAGNQDRRRCRRSRNGNFAVARPPQRAIGLESGVMDRSGRGYIALVISPLGHSRVRSRH